MGTFGGSTLNTNASRVNQLTLAGGANPSVRLDLSNNEMIIDCSGASPLNDGTNSVLFSQVVSAYNGGSWTGNGITSDIAIANAAAGSVTFAIGYGEASVNYNISGSATATFASQTVDATTALLKLTYYGDANLDGTTNIADFSRLSANFNQAGLWTEGDATYDGLVNISDFARMSANFNLDQVLRGHRLLPLYIAMLDHPAIYWESKLWTEFWNQNFAIFESMNLGAAPAVPQYLVARGVPEPGTLTVALGVAALAMLRRRCKVAITSSRPASVCSS